MIHDPLAVMMEFTLDVPGLMPLSRRDTKVRSAGLSKGTRKKVFEKRRRISSPPR
jgi:hypothetical protein